MLIDSNIIIYSVQPEYEDLRQLIAENSPSISVISYVEVLGFHNLEAADQQLFENFFSIAPLLPISKPILDRAIELRQEKRMSLGDSLIAATCLVYDLTLVTRNSSDFSWISKLRVINPFDSPPAAVTE